MNPWLERALVSWAAGAVATTVIVTTAKNPNKKKKKRGKKKKKSGDGIKVAVDDAIPRSTGAQAAHDYRMGTDRSMTGDELVENVKGLGKKAKRAGQYIAAGLFGQTVPKKSDGDEKVAAKKVDAKKADVIDRDRDDRGGRAKHIDVVEDAKRALRDAAVGKVADEAAERAGVAGVVDELKEQGGEIKERAAKVVQGIKDAIPDDAGDKLKQAGTTVADAGKKAGEAVADAGKKAGAAIKDALTAEKIGELEKKLDGGLKKLGRWFQGPGAPKDDDAPTNDDDVPPGPGAPN